VITRLWRGWTPPNRAEDYERFLLEELFPSMGTIPGFLGADVLRRRDGDEVAFVTLTRFESLDAIRAFRRRGLRGSRTRTAGTGGALTPRGPRRALRHKLVSPPTMSHPGVQIPPLTAQSAVMSRKMPPGEAKSGR
jgi:heme-degrading monooxygenase HmoA